MSFAMKNQKPAMTIGIAGGTVSGKSTLAKALLHTYASRGACLIDLDSYYFDRSHLTEPERARLNYDEPDAIDHALLAQQLALLAGGESIEKPLYCFGSHTRSGRETVEPVSVIIVEGLFAFWDRSVRDLLDYKIFVDADADLRFIRRLKRDIAERGRTTESVIEQYETTVRPMHQMYIEKQRSLADVVLQNNHASDDLVEKAVGALEAGRLLDYQSISA